VPVATLPGWLQPVAAHQPLTTVVDALRALLLGRPVGSTAVLALAECALVVAVCVPVAGALFARRNG
jgi:ABC-2 type transport system permease protein